MTATERMTATASVWRRRTLPAHNVEASNHDLDPKERTMGMNIRHSVPSVQDNQKLEPRGRRVTLTPSTRTEQATTLTVKSIELVADDVAAQGDLITAAYLRLEAALRRTPAHARA